MTQQTREQRGRPSSGWPAGFGRRLLRARTRAGLTQQALGAPDLSKSFVSLLEAGRSHPSIETAMALARRVGGSIAALLLEPDDLAAETAFNLLQIASEPGPIARAADATRLVEAAETLLPEMPGEMRAMAQMARARIALASGDLREAETRAEEAAGSARAVGAGGLLGMAIAVRGEALLQRQDYSGALRVLDEATVTMQRAKAIRTEEGVSALILLGRAAQGAGRLDTARKAYRRAVELAARIDARDPRAEALAGLASVESAAGRTAVAGSLLAQVAGLREKASPVSAAGGTTAQLPPSPREGPS